jgi:hypothetical protein
VLLDPAAEVSGLGVAHDLTRVADRLQILAEGERKNLHPRTEKLDLELAIGDGFRLSDQLIQTLFGHRASALFVNVTPRTMDNSEGNPIGHLCSR